MEQIQTTCNLLHQFQSRFDFTRVPLRGKKACTATDFLPKPCQEVMMPGGNSQRESGTHHGWHASLYSRCVCATSFSTTWLPFKSSHQPDECNGLISNSTVDSSQSPRNTMRRIGVGRLERCCRNYGSTVKSMEHPSSKGYVTAGVVAWHHQTSWIR